jgi:hypothetical protein
VVGVVLSHRSNETGLAKRRRMGNDFGDYEENSVNIWKLGAMF